MLSVSYISSLDQLNLIVMIIDNNVSRGSMYLKNDGIIRNIANSKWKALI